MSLVSEIITQAYRETNLIPMGTVPNANQIAEALLLFNTILISTVGNEAGDSLVDLNVGGLYDESDVLTPWVPRNARLVFNQSFARTLYLDPEPSPGQRLGFADAAANLATYPVTLLGNGRTIEGVSSLVLNVNSDTRQWIYNPVTANWAKITTLLTTDQMPFPSQYDFYFVTMLAVRLNPRYGQTLSQESLEALKMARKYMINKHRGKTEEYPEYIGIIGEKRGYSFDVSSFGRGLFRWR